MIGQLSSRFASGIGHQSSPDGRGCPTPWSSEDAKYAIITTVACEPLRGIRGTADISRATSAGAPRQIHDFSLTSGVSRCQSATNSPSGMGLLGQLRQARGRSERR